RFGSMPVSKPLLLYLQRHHSRLIVVDGDGGWNEPTLLASDMIYADARLLCEALVEALSHREHRESHIDPQTSAISVISMAKRIGWAGAWQSAARSAHTAIAARFEALDELFEGRVFAELAALLPAGALLYAGNSMPIRDLDTFFPGGERAIRLLANRGANGI